LMREGSIYGFEVAPDGTRLYVSQKAGGVSRRALDPTAPQRRVVSTGGTPCTDGSHVYETVAAALAAANAGDTLVVCPGSYTESVTVDRAVRLDSFAGPSRTSNCGVTWSSETRSTCRSC
jgi:pectin methylesterase-like acyl-CoA thioesterase